MTISANKCGEYADVPAMGKAKTNIYNSFSIRYSLQNGRYPGGLRIRIHWTWKSFVLRTATTGCIRGISVTAVWSFNLLQSSCGLLSPGLVQEFYYRRKLLHLTSRRRANAIGIRHSRVTSPDTCRWTICQAPYVTATLSSFTLKTLTANVMFYALLSSFAI